MHLVGDRCADYRAFGTDPNAVVGSECVGIVGWTVDLVAGNDVGFLGYCADTGISSHVVRTAHMAWRSLVPSGEERCPSFAGDVLSVRPLGLFASVVASLLVVASEDVLSPWGAQLARQRGSSG